MRDTTVRRASRHGVKTVPVEHGRHRTEEAITEYARRKTA